MSTLKLTRVKIHVSSPPVQPPAYRSGFWNQTPEEAMEQPHVWPGKAHVSFYGRVVGEGCYVTPAASSHGAD